MATPTIASTSQVGTNDDFAGGELAVDFVVVVKSQPNLFHVAFALCATCCFTSLLHSRKQQSNQDCDDGDYDQQLDQRKASRSTPANAEGGYGHVESPREQVRKNLVKRQKAV